METETEKSPYNWFERIIHRFVRFRARTKATYLGELRLKLFHEGFDKQEVVTLITNLTRRK